MEISKRLILLCSILFLFIISGMGNTYDLRAVKIEKFLTKYAPFSPLRGKAHEILYCADLYNLDYRLYVAIAGAESSFGKRYPKRTNNLTGIVNGDMPFSSIYDNIHGTHKLIATGKWYKKYHETKKIEDLVHIYKGVPPYQQYISTVKFVMHEINDMPIDREIRSYAALPSFKQKTDIKLAAVLK